MEIPADLKNHFENAFWKIHSLKMSFENGVQKMALQKFILVNAGAHEPNSAPMNNIYFSFAWNILCLCLRSSCLGLTLLCIPFQVHVLFNYE